MAQWIARRTSNPEAVGSSPTGGRFFKLPKSFFCRVASFVCLFVR